MSFTHPTDEAYSFEGVGVFTDGKLHMGPFTCIDGKGYGRSYSMMLNGRPGDNQFFTKFLPDDSINNSSSNVLYLNNFSGWPVIFVQM